MAFAKGDPEFLWVLFKYRYLKSGQMSEIIGRSNQVVRRRMRALAAAGYVVALERDPMQEQVYCLGTKGYEYVASELKTAPHKLPYSRKAAKVDSLFFRHYLLTNQVWIAFDLAALDHESVAIHRTIPEWEMKDSMAKDRTKKFVLWEQLHAGEGSNEHVYPFRPDCLFLTYKWDEGPNKCTALYLESDRGTEAVSSRIRDKFTSYRLYYQSSLFNTLFNATFMRCLFVLDGVRTERRIRTMQMQLQAYARDLGDTNPQEGSSSPAAFVWCFRFTHIDRVNKDSVFDEPIWHDWLGNTQSLLRQDSAKKAPCIKNDGIAIVQ